MGFGWHKPIRQESLADSLADVIAMFSPTYVTLAQINMSVTLKMVN